MVRRLEIGAEASIELVDELREGDLLVVGAAKSDLWSISVSVNESRNLKTAKALGLEVPDKLLVAADEVLE